MTQEEFKNEYEAIKLKAATEEYDLIRKFCNANNPYKKGDVFTDHFGSIIVETIGYLNRDIPSCRYFGIELKKDGTPRKDGKKRWAYQVNDINKR